MKKEFTIYAFLLLAIVSLSVVDPNSYWNKEIKSTVLDISPYNRIFIDLPAEIYITQGNNNKIVIEAPNEYMEEIKQQLNGNTSLSINSIKSGKLSSLTSTGKVSEDIKVYINSSCLGKLKIGEKAQVISSEYCVKTLKSIAEKTKEDEKALLFFNFSSLVKSLGAIHLL